MNICPVVQAVGQAGQSLSLSINMTATISTKSGSGRDHDGADSGVLQLGRGGGGQGGLAVPSDRAGNRRPRRQLGSGNLISF